MTTGSSLAPHVDATAVQRNASVPSQFAQLSEGAAVAAGREVIDAASLVGVPFLITSATFRDGTPRREKVDGKVQEFPTNYVSLEIMIGDSAALDRAMQRAVQRKRETAINNLGRFDPEELLVLNDGSTGIYRQVVSFLVETGRLAVPAGEDGGMSGQSRFDTYRSQWTGWDSTKTTDPTFPFMLLCPRGTRESRYEFGTDEAITHYLA